MSLPPEVLDFQVIKLTGWTPAEIDAAPAALVDWILALAGVEAEVQAEQIEKSRRG